MEEIAAYDDEYVEEGNSISLIKGNLCRLVIDSGSCTNVVSSLLVKRFQLSVHPHPKPYKLQWLTNKEEIKVNSQALFLLLLEDIKMKSFVDGINITHAEAIWILGTLSTSIIVN